MDVNVRRYHEDCEFKRLILVFGKKYEAKQGRGRRIGGNTHHLIPPCYVAPLSAVNDIPKYFAVLSCSTIVAVTGGRMLRPRRSGQLHSLSLHPFFAY